MKITRRVAGLASVAVAAVALPLMTATPASAACAPGTYPPASCAPTVALTSPTSVVSLGSTRVAWRVINSATTIKSYQVRYERTAYNGSYGGWVTPSAWAALTSPALLTTVPVGYTECFSVRATDTANRVGGWSAARCTVRPLDDRSFSLGRGWVRGTSRRYYFGTYSTTTRGGAIAVLPYGRTTRIGVVATQCPSCGEVGVYVGSRLLGKLDFASSVTHTQAVLYTGRFPLLSGRVTIKNLVAGRRVLLDGVAVGRA